MSDRLTACAPDPRAAAEAVPLTSHGRLWARLLAGGRYLEIAERGVVVVFDLWESARRGRGILVEEEDAE